MPSKIATLLIIVGLLTTFMLLLNLVNLSSGSGSKEKSKYLYEGLKSLQKFQQPRSEIVLNNTSLSKEEKRLLLLVVVITAPENFDRRKAIRSTWLNSYEQNGRKFFVKFVIGIFDLDEETYGKLLLEYSKFNDLVFLEDHLDSYKNLPRKVLRMFVWADQNVEFAYMLKIDDDCFPRLDAITAELEDRESSLPLYWGAIGKNHIPLKEGKWKEENWDLGEKYIPYAHGGGYILSSELVHQVAINHKSLRVYNNEDVSVGVWVCPFIQERRDDLRFHPHEVCKENKLIHHLTKPEEIFMVHDSLMKNASICPSLSEE